MQLLCNIRAQFSVTQGMHISILSLVLAGFILTSCFTLSLSGEERLELILKSGSSCSAPCWKDINPGVSSEVDLISLVESTDATAFDNFRYHKLRQNGFEYLWNDKQMGALSRARFVNGIVTILQFQLYDGEISLNEIIDLLAQPSAYGASTVVGEESYVLLRLIYEADGVVVEASIPVNLNELNVIEANCEYKVDWDMPHRRLWIYLTEPGPAETMLEHNILGGLANPAYRPQPWSESSPLPLTWCP